MFPIDVLDNSTTSAAVNFGAANGVGTGAASEFEHATGSKTSSSRTTIAAYDLEKIEW